MNLPDADVITIGDGVSRVQRPYRHVPALWGRWIFSDRIDNTQQRPAVPGD